MLDFAGKIRVLLVGIVFGLLSFTLVGSVVYGYPFNWCQTKNYFVTVTAPAQGLHGNLNFQGKVCRKDDPLDKLMKTIREMVKAGEKDPVIVDSLTIL